MLLFPGPWLPAGTSAVFLDEQEGCHFSQTTCRFFKTNITKRHQHKPLSAIPLPLPAPFSCTHFQPLSPHSIHCKLVIGKAPGQWV